MAVRLPRLLDGSMQELARLNPASLSLDENLAPLSTAQMVLPEGECAAETGQLVELYTSHGSAGVFRVQQAEQDYGGRVTLALEHGLTTLGDGIMPGEGEQSGTARQLVSDILACQPKTMWVLGRVDVPNSLTLTWKNDNANMLESLCSLMDELPGYRLTFDQSVFPWVLNIEALPDADGCECRLSRNLSSLRVEEDRSELCTRLYVSGLASPLDADTIGTYGVITRYMDADPDIGEAELTKQGRAFLEAHKSPAISVTMDAVDWYEATGEPFDRFTLGKVCRVCLPDYGRTIRQRVIGLSWPDVYGQPDQVTVKLASESTTAVSVMTGLIIDTTITRKRVTSLSSALDRQKEILIAAEDKITLMSTRIELIAQEVEINAEQIALKASSEEVGELTRRMSAAEVAIDGANARIDLKANQTTVDDLGTRVSAAEVAIDGANAEIALKVSKNGVVSAINMSTEGIKISASRIELSGTVIAGYLNGTSIDVNELSASMVYASGGIQAPSATIDGAYIGDLDCDSLSIGGTGYSGKSRTVVVGQQTLTPTYVTIQYKDHSGNNQYTQVVKAVTINDAPKATISYLGT
ncbi:MAG: phage tail spike protein [Eubacteriales bacterium]|nr:phage tail spike protein [Eubacteriales bacterium]